LPELNIEGGNPIILYPKANHVRATFTLLDFPANNIGQAVEGTH